MGIEQAILNSRETITRGHAVITTDHAFIHEKKAFSLSGALVVASADVGAIAIAVPGMVAASKTFDMTAATSDLTYTAVKAGADGNTISVAHVDPEANDAELAISVNVHTIVVSLATDEEGTITSTAAEVAAAINAHAEASELVTCADEGEGTGIVNALEAAFLTGGTDPAYVHLKLPVISTTGGPVTAALIEDATVTGTLADLTPKNHHRINPSASVLICKRTADAAVVNGEDVETLESLLLPGTSTGHTLGSSSGTDNEFVLCPGKNYLVTFTNQTNPGASVTVGYGLFWYEEDAA